MAKRACKLCRRVLKGTTCPVCNSNETTSTFQGSVIIFDASSEVAKKLKIDAPGRYAIKV